MVLNHFGDEIRRNKRHVCKRNQRAEYIIRQS